MSGKTKPPYPEAFRQQIVELVASGREVGELAREFNVNSQSIHNWWKRAGPTISSRSSPGCAPARLRRRVCASSRASG